MKQQNYDIKKDEWTAAAALALCLQPSVKKKKKTPFQCICLMFCGYWACGWKTPFLFYGSQLHVCWPLTAEISSRLEPAAVPAEEFVFESRNAKWTALMERFPILHSPPRALFPKAFHSPIHAHTPTGRLLLLLCDALPVSLEVNQGSVCLNVLARLEGEQWLELDCRAWD